MNKNIYVLTVCALAILLSCIAMAVQQRVWITISTEKNTFRSGEPIDLTVTWRNIYYRPVLWYFPSGGIDAIYPPTILWNGKKRVDSSWDPSNALGSIRVQGGIPPGTARSDIWQLDNHDMTREGFYTIQVAWHDIEANSYVKSNTIRIYVVK